MSNNNDQLLERVRHHYAVLTAVASTTGGWDNVRPWWPYSYKACAGGFVLLQGPPA